MATVSETELDQKISDLISFVKDFAANRSKDFHLVGKHDDFEFFIQGKEVTLEFDL